MRDTTAAGPRTRAGRRPRSPGSSFRIIRVRHEAARQIVLPVLTTMSFVPQFHVMLEHAIAKTHLEDAPFLRCKMKEKGKKTEEDWGKGWRGSSRERKNTWELRDGEGCALSGLLFTCGPCRVATRAWLTSVGSNVGVIPLSDRLDKV